MSGHVTVTRYRRPSDPVEVWGVVPEGDGWSAYGPAGESYPPQASLVEALDRSGALRFEEGAALRVDTGGALMPLSPGDAWAPSNLGPGSETVFSLLPALRGWSLGPHECCERKAPALAVDPDTGARRWISPSEHEDPDAGHDAHPDVREAAEQLDSAYGELYYCTERVIVVDGFLVACAVSGYDASCRHLVVHDSEENRPLFFDLWLHLFVNNGYGSADYFIGEVSPGVLARFAVIDSSVEFEVEVLKPTRAERSFDEVSGILAEQEWLYESDFGSSRLMIQGSEVVLVGEDGERVAWPDVSGRIGPTPQRSRS